MPKKTGKKKSTKKKTAGDKKSEPKKPEAKWRKVLLARVGVTDDVLSKLAKANILTVGDAANYMLGGTAFDAVNNVSKDEADNIVSMLDDWFVQNPKGEGGDFDEYLIPSMLPENHRQLLKVAKRLRHAQHVRADAQEAENALKESLLEEFEKSGVVATADGTRRVTIEGYTITVKDKNPSVSIKPPKEEVDDEDDE